MTHKLRILSCVGARPNFMKIAPFVHALDAHPDRFTHCLVHTGQHYDRAMSDTFFTELGIPHPDVDLEIGSGTHAEQVGRTMMAFEKTVREWKPDWVVVVGDVNATCACSITAKKECVRVAHIEAGLRSFDLTMPEEINRMVTDRLSDLLFTPDEISSRNLAHEGAPDSAIRFVGNIMIDTLEKHRDRAAALSIDTVVRRHYAGTRPPPTGLAESGFTLVTLHRPSNVDARETLADLLDFFVTDAADDRPLIWALHPRTRKQLATFGLMEKAERCARLHLVDPLGYLEMLRLNMSAHVVLTDSGGLQEECCVLGTPCVTLRENTERPVTLISHGGLSDLAGNRIERVREVYHRMKQLPRREARPPLWDGHTAERIVDTFQEYVRS
jgi:UDP-N-acetylglucosamine 2-epimerase (non-hydrolysing)